ncbi:hypothetical protein DFS34DRAFT_630773 [Phlyctochytrium arcticum]|nr:hypothetical protein DFS34DRAFT_630773 [Phlyctochytrium arcticum]
MDEYACPCLNVRVQVLATAPVDETSKAPSLPESPELLISGTLRLLGPVGIHIEHGDLVDLSRTDEHWVQALCTNCGHAFYFSSDSEGGTDLPSSESQSPTMITISEALVSGPQLEELRTSATYSDAFRILIEGDHGDLNDDLHLDFDPIVAQSPGYILNYLSAYPDPHLRNSKELYQNFLKFIAQQKEDMVRRIEAFRTTEQEKFDSRFRDTVRQYAILEHRIGERRPVKQSPVSSTPAAPESSPTAPVDKPSLTFEKNVSFSENVVFSGESLLAHVSVPLADKKATPDLTEDTPEEAVFSIDGFEPPHTPFPTTANDEEDDAEDEDDQQNATQHVTPPPANFDLSSSLPIRIPYLRSDILSKTAPTAHLHGPGPLSPTLEDEVPVSPEEASKPENEDDFVAPHVLSARTYTQDYLLNHRPSKSRKASFAI